MSEPRTRLAQWLIRVPEWVYVVAGVAVGQVIFWLFVFGPLTRWMGTL